MKIDSSSPPHVVAALADVAEGKITHTPWDCDIRSILASIINLRSRAAISEGSLPEPGFEVAASNWMTLPTLIARDIAELSPLHSFLNRIPNLLLLEAFSQNPNAQTFLRTEIRRQPHTVIIFHTPVVWYLNAFFQKFHIFAADDIYTGCLDVQNAEMESEIYDDLHILVAIFNDLEVLFNRKFINHSPTPPFLGQPYDICEQVDGARQFIVGHEAGHLVVETAGNDNGISTIRKDLNGSVGKSFSDQQIASWANELWCDEFAIRILNQRYLEMQDDQRRQDVIGNSLRGILLFLFMLHIIEVSLGRHRQVAEAYPPAEIRYSYACQAMKNLRFFEDEFTRNGVKSFHHRLRGTLKGLAGLTPSVKYGSLHIALQPYLSDFSRSLCNNLFERVRLSEEADGWDQSPWSSNPF